MKYLTSIILLLISISMAQKDVKPIFCTCMDWDMTGPGLQGKFKFDNMCDNRLLYIDAKQYLYNYQPVEHKWTSDVINLRDDENPPHPAENRTIGLSIFACCTRNDDMCYYGQFLPSDCPKCSTRHK